MSLRPRTAGSAVVAAPAAGGEVAAGRLAHVLGIGHRFVQQQAEVGKYWSAKSEKSGYKEIDVWSEPYYFGKREWVTLRVDAFTKISHHEKARVVFCILPLHASVLHRIDRFCCFV